MLKPLFLSALLLFTPSLLRAEDPVLFFDGPAHGWKITDSFFNSDSHNGRDYFIGYTKNKNKNYIYYLDNNEQKIVDYDYIYNNAGGTLLSVEDVFQWGPRIILLQKKSDREDFYMRFFDAMREFDPKNSADEDGYDGGYEWFALIKRGGMHRDDSGLIYKAYFDYDMVPRVDDNYNLYVHSAVGGFFYKIPKFMRGKIIIRDRLAYLPWRFLAAAVKKNPNCLKKNRKTSVAGSVEVCLDGIFRSLPKGDYDDDTPYPIPVKR